MSDINTERFKLNSLSCVNSWFGSTIYTFILHHVYRHISSSSKSSMDVELRTDVMEHVRHNRSAAFF